MIYCPQLRKLIIYPSLSDIGMYCADSEELIVAIVAHESKGGHYLAQLNGGPALGICQMETETFVDLWNKELFSKDETGNYKHNNLHSKIMKACNFMVAPFPKELVNNLKLSVIMCRVFFLRVKESLPSKDNIEQIAAYWKKYYNTSGGKGEVEEFIQNYHNYTKAA